MFSPSRPPGRRAPATALLLAGAALLGGCDREPLVAPPGPTARPAPIAVSASNTFTEAAVGYGHRCAVRSDGAVECAGANAEGQAPPTRTAAVGRFTQVAAGWRYTCALRDDGAVECWGLAGVASTWEGNYGQAPALRTASSGRFVQVSAGFDQTCAVRDDGVVECWGNDLWGVPDAWTPAQGKFVQVAVGRRSVYCALRDDGVVECWGHLVWRGDLPETFVASTGHFTQVSVWYGSMCAVRSDGVIQCVGTNTSGQAPPTRVAGSGGFTRVATSNTTTCGVRTDGAAECWGRGLEGTRTAAGGRYLDVSVGFVDGELTVCTPRTGGAVECWRGPDDTGALWSASGSTVTHVLPVATLAAPGSPVVATQPFALALTGAHVPGYPVGMQFTYAFDCGDGAGYGAFGRSGTTTCATAAAGGTRIVRGAVRDQDGDTQEYAAAVPVVQVTLAVTATGTVDRRTGLATVTGTATCSGPVTLAVAATLTQTQKSGRTTTTVAGTGQTAVGCGTGGPATWTASVAGANGAAFAAGTATARATVAGTSPAVQSAVTTVQLK